MEGNALLEPLPGVAQLTKAPFEPIKEASLEHLTFKMVFLLAQGRANAEVRYMLGKTRTLDTSLFQSVPVPITQLSFQESAGQRGSRQCGPSGPNSE